ncbi:hypothetical protein COCON_G00128170 [Conger conger]|uniref:Uncharacterized protein n=1 Tax=Conger conger TaxID=82655 RepID=A0A9Q1DDZ4_CONCO|nr:hypothetical protein COCON_G00128170 [Conger conger]
MLRKRAVSLNGLFSGCERSVRHRPVVPEGPGPAPSLPSRSQIGGVGKGLCGQGFLLQPGGLHRTPLHKDPLRFQVACEGCPSPGHLPLCPTAAGPDVNRATVGRGAASSPESQRLPRSLTEFERRRRGGPTQKRVEEEGVKPRVPSRKAFDVSGPVESSQLQLESGAWFLSTPWTVNRTRTLAARTLMEFLQGSGDYCHAQHRSA